MKLPPDQTAVFSAANLLSPTGITVAKYSWNSSGCSLSAVSVSWKMTPFSSRSSRILWYTTSDSYCAATPAIRRCFSASGMPSLS